MVERMLRDEQLERLNAASGVLALIGTDSFLSIKEGLARSKGDEVNFGAEALVDALQLLEPSQDALDASGITPVLEKFSEYPDPDVREAVRELLGDGIRP